MTVTALLVRSLRYGATIALTTAIVAGTIGFLAAGGPGLAGGLLGAVLSALFLGLTAISILVASRVAGGDLTSPSFFGIVLGTWTLKLIVFFVISLWLRGQDWVHPVAFGLTAIAAVLASLVADAVAFVRSRIPLDVELPSDTRSVE